MFNLAHFLFRMKLKLYTHFVWQRLYKYLCVKAFSQSDSPLNTLRIVLQPGLLKSDVTSSAVSKALIMDAFSLSPIPEMRVCCFRLIRVWKMLECGVKVGILFTCSHRKQQQTNTRFLMRTRGRCIYYGKNDSTMQRAAPVGWDTPCECYKEWLFLDSKKIILWSYRDTSTRVCNSPWVCIMKGTLHCTWPFAAHRDQSWKMYALHCIG